MISGATLCFIVMFGMAWVNLELIGIVETSTEHIKAETVIAKQESDHLDKQLEVTRNKVDELIKNIPKKYCRKEFCHGRGL
jgi:hypothetical protein